MMRATGAKLRMLASEAELVAEGPRMACGEEGESCGEGDIAPGRLRRARETGEVRRRAATGQAR